MAGPLVLAWPFIAKALTAAGIAGAGAYTAHQNKENIKEGAEKVIGYGKKVWEDMKVLGATTAALALADKKPISYTPVYERSVPIMMTEGVADTTQVATPPVERTDSVTQNSNSTTSSQNNSPEPPEDDKKSKVKKLAEQVKKFKENYPKSYKGIKWGTGIGVGFYALPWLAGAGVEVVPQLVEGAGERFEKGRQAVRKEEEASKAKEAPKAKETSTSESSEKEQKVLPSKTSYSMQQLDSIYNSL